MVRQQRIDVFGDHTLRGTARNQGSKNGALALLAASVACRGSCVFINVPRCRDVEVMLQGLRSQGCRIDHTASRVVVNGAGLDAIPALGPWATRIRASAQLLGPLAVRTRHFTLPFPGGCPIGPRPLDIHVEGLRSLGASVRTSLFGIEVSHAGLNGADLHLSFPSVGATTNLVIAATAAEGTTRISNAALEPEIDALLEFLNAAGGQVVRAPSGVIEVEGPTSLEGATAQVIPDRIAAGTILFAGAGSGDPIELTHVNPQHMTAVLEVLRRLGAHLSVGGNTIRIMHGRLDGVDVTALPYPGFPTDLQPILTALCCRADGASRIIDKVFDERMGYLEELKKMGAQVRTEGNAALVTGGPIHGADVEMHDLRGGAALVIGALGATGKTQIAGAAVLERGYVGLPGVLYELGADVQLYDL